MSALSAMGLRPTSSTVTRCVTVLTIPRISGRSSLTTVSFSRLRPSERRVCRWLNLPPMPDLTWVTLRRGHVRPPRSGAAGAAAAAARARSMAAGATSSRGRPRLAAISSGRTRPSQGGDGRVDDVDRVGGPERLAQHVVDAGALEHGAHRATGDDAGTGAGRLEQHDAGGRLALDRVRDGRADARHAEEVLLGLLDALGDRRGHLLGLAVADADLAVAVAHDHEGGEAEATTALHDLGDAVDRDDALDVRVLLDRAATATRPSRPPPAAPPAWPPRRCCPGIRRSSSCQRCACRSASERSARSRGRRRPGPRCDRGTCCRRGRRRRRRRPPPWRAAATRAPTWRARALLSPSPLRSAARASTP